MTDESDAKRGRGITLYRAADAEDVQGGGASPPPVFPAEDLQVLEAEQLDISPAANGSFIRMLFRGAGGDGFSLLEAWFGPGLVLPRHSHNADCLYYIVDGSLTMGARTLQAGDGFFVPAGAPYAYEAGPDGVTVLEFRQRTSYDMIVPSGQVDRFRRLAEVSAANAQRWAELRRERYGEAV